MFARLGSVAWNVRAFVVAGQKGGKVRRRRREVHETDDEKRSANEEEYDAPRAHREARTPV